MKGYLGKDLQQKYRTLRTLPGQLLLGPTGARLFADYLEPVRALWEELILYIN